MKHQLDSILDDIVDNVCNEFPDKSEFEAAFTAVRLNLMVVTRTLTEIGMSGSSLSNEALFNICTGLTATCTWMVAKEMAADVVRDIDDL